MIRRKGFFQKFVFSLLVPYLLLCSKSGAQPPTDLSWDNLKYEFQLELTRILDNADTNPWILQACEQTLGDHDCNYQDQYSRFYFDQALTSEERIQLLATLFKLRSENLLSLIATIIWTGGDGGVVLFRPRIDADHFASILKAQGYVTRFGAASREAWGLRSPHKGAQLHFRQTKRGLISVHIDLHNPAIEAISDWNPIFLAYQTLRHVTQDWLNREETHNAARIQSAIEQQELRWLEHLSAKEP